MIEYTAHLRSDGELMAKAAERDLGNGLNAHIPSCPEWNMGKLVIHTGGHHRWVADSVRGGGEPPPNPGKPGRRGAELIEWFRQGWQELAALLDESDDDAPAWTWSDEQRVGFWRRRTALETMVHRWDAENATGERSPLDPLLASDGVDEMLFVFVPRANSIYKGAPGRVRLITTDAPGDWIVELQDGKEAEPARSTGTGSAADVVVKAPASDLCLFLWGRLAADFVQADGDPELVDSFVRWVAE